MATLVTGGIEYVSGPPKRKKKSTMLKRFLFILVWAVYFVPMMLIVCILIFVLWIWALIGWVAKGNTDGSEDFFDNAINWVAFLPDKIFHYKAP